MTDTPATPQVDPPAPDHTEGLGVAVVISIVLALVGIAIWTAATFLAGPMMNVLAWLVALLAGLGIGMFSRGNKSTRGSVALVIAIVALLIAQPAIAWAYYSGEGQRLGDDPDQKTLAWIYLVENTIKRNANADTTQATASEYMTGIKFADRVNDPLMQSMVPGYAEDYRDEYESASDKPETIGQYIASHRPPLDVMLKGPYWMELWAKPLPYLFVALGLISAFMLGSVQKPVRRID